jgi:hypothetical protein
MTIEATVVGDLYHSCRRYHQGFAECRMLKPAGVLKNHKAGRQPTWSNWPEHGWFYYRCDSCRKNCYSQSDLGK